MDTSKILLNQIYDDLGYDNIEIQNIFNNDFNISSNINLLIEFIIYLNNGKYIKPECITNSSGFVVVIIFKHFVIKIFRNSITLNKILDIIQYNTSCHIVKLNSYLSKTIYTDANISEKSFYAISTNKIFPIIKYSQVKGELLINLNDDLIIIKLISQIIDALYMLHINGYCHNDCTLDNIGILDDKFILFDFNLSNKSTNIKIDICSLINSIKFNIEYNIDKELLNVNTKRLLNYLDDINYLVVNTFDLMFYIRKYYNEYYSNNILSDSEFNNIITEIPIK